MPIQPQSRTISHIIELRKKLMISMGVLLAAFLIYFIFCQPLFDLLGQPLLRHLPNYQIIATQVTAPLTILLKLSMLCAVFTTIPVFIYQFCAFIAPGLYQHEKKLFFPLIALSTFLFYLGGLFAFFIVCPLALSFFYHFAPSQVTVMTDIGAYFSFISNMVMIFALCFQIPMLIYSALYFNIINKNSFQNKRGYIVVGCFVLGMLLTPPDVISQMLLAVPLMLLFELGLILYRFFPNQTQSDPHRY